jgi:nucleotide-binding universal stress UspA family protein
VTKKVIVSAVDGSASSHTAALRAAELARADGRPLLLVHVYHIPARAWLMGTWSVEHTDASLWEAARSNLGQLAAEIEASFSVRVETLVIEGVPWRQVVRVASERGADLIVVGAQGPTGLGDALIGSVAERVVRHAPCSVLVVRDEAATGSG